MNSPSYREFEPPAALAEHVACLWVRQVGAPDPGPARVLPDGSADIMMLIDGTDVSALVAGPDTTAKLSVLPPGSRMVGVRFRPGVAPAVLGLPLDELRDQRVGLAELWGTAAAELTEQVAEAERPELVMAAAVRRRLRDSAPDPAADAIVRTLEHSTGPGVVGRLAWELGLSERHLQRRCRTAFGYGPKTLQQVLRFQRAVRLARAGGRLADVAAVTGYADQAHLARECRRLSGVSLTELLQ